MSPFCRILGAPFDLILPRNYCNNNVIIGSLRPKKRNFNLLHFFASYRLGISHTLAVHTYVIAPALFRMDNYGS